MDFTLTQDQELLARTAADFVAKGSPVSRARKLRDHPLGFDPKVYAQMAELGWLAIPFGEDVGGIGGSFVELALVLEQLGTTLVPEPIVPTLVAGVAIDRAADAAQRERLLGPALEGKRMLALAHGEPDTRFSTDRCSTIAERDGDGNVLRGRKTWVLNGHAAQLLVVSARLEGALRLFVVESSAVGVQTMPLHTFDGRRAAHVVFEGVKLHKDQLLSGTNIEAVLLQVQDFGAACAVAEGVGLTQRVLDMTVEYLNTRVQFDVKIGSFQALQHRAVDMFIETQLLRSIAYESMVRALDSDAAERIRAISAAKTQLSVGGKYVTRQAIQLHGGIGCTDEHDIGLYFKRMHVLNTLFGDEEFHVRRYASQLSA
jgi:alkylation response protein AidB-like acyl-CoA dehydrogenase